MAKGKRDRVVSAARVSRTEVGRVAVGLDARLVVSTTTFTYPSGERPTRTPTAVDVRREQEHVRDDEPGAMSPRRAGELAALLVAAADAAEGRRGAPADTPREAG